MASPIVIGIASAGAGIVSGYFLRLYIAKLKASGAEKKAQEILEKAGNKEKDLLLNAKEKALKIIDEAKEEEKNRRKELQKMQSRLERREETFDKKLISLEDRSDKLRKTEEKLKEKREKIEEIQKQQLEKLEKIGKLSQDDAREQLFARVEEDMQEALQNRLRKIEREAEMTAADKANELVGIALQRYSASHAADMMTSVVDLPSDDMKGRIIGREGRNIKAFERVTGADVIIDDTPNAITLSCFSPIRREVAKRTMEILIKDGRIQPARIEEAMQEAKKSLAVEIKKAGEDAVYEVGAVGLEPKLVQIVGRLKYRTSYGQNILRHSIETAHIAGVLAQELGADVTSAKLGGLLHDIGKAFDHDIQGTHVEIGINLGKKFGVNDKVMSAIAEHHDDVPTTLEGVIVKVADAISGARPGARSDTKENYIQRLRDLEEIANGFDGVDKAYAIQAGREIRVFVDAASVKDNHCTKIAQDMAKRIESSLKYPGEIKVNIIRETRTIEYAR